MTFVYFLKFPGLTPADMEVVDTNPGKGKKHYKVSVSLLMDILCTVILTNDSMCSVTGQDLRWEMVNFGILRDSLSKRG